MCSTPNRVESVFCSNCGARLVPLTAAAMPEAKPPAPPIKGLSLPAKPVVSAEESPPPTAAPEEPAEPAAGESPDGIAQMHAPEPAPEEGSVVPDWLARLRAATPPEEALPAEPEPEQEMPDWLIKSAGEPAAETPPEPAAQVPDWLKNARIESAEQPSDAHIAEEELPDWLTQAEPGAALAAEDQVELPGWLKGSVAETPGAEQASDAQVAESAEPEQVIEQIEPTEPLLESLETTEPPPVAPEPPAEPAVVTDDYEIPDWLRTPMPAQSPAAPVPDIEPPRPEEVPAWVAALKPADISSPAPAMGLESAELESEGPLEGLRGVLPLALAIAEPHAAVASEAPVPPGQTDGGQIFESILAAPAQVAAPVAKPPRRILTLRPFIYLLLFLAVLVPFILPFDLTGSTFKIAGTPAAEFFDALQQVPTGSTVLLSFDYDPSLSGEMDLQARAIARDLVKRQVKIIAVSTLETGPQIAQRILDGVAKGTDNYTYGSSYVIVYLPGHEAGLAQLAVAGLPTTDDFVEKKSIEPFLTAAKFKTLRDLPMVIEFAGSEEPLRMWVEQVQPRTGMRLAAAVSAAVEPKARAYRNANQLTAMLGGLLGAAQYEVLSNQPGLAVISVNAQTAAQLVLVFVIILGNIVFWISRARGDAK